MRLFLLTSLAVTLCIHWYLHSSEQSHQNMVKYIGSFPGYSFRLHPLEHSLIQTTNGPHLSPLELLTGFSSKAIKKMLLGKYTRKELKKNSKTNFSIWIENMKSLTGVHKHVKSDWCLDKEFVVLLKSNHQNPEGTHWYGLYRYVWHQRVWFSAGLVIDKVTVPANLVIKRVWLLYSDWSWTGYVFFFLYKATC